MNFEEQAAILSRFEELRPNLLNEVGVLGIFWESEGAEVVLTVRVDDFVRPGLVEDVERLSPMKHEFGGREASIRIKVEVGEEFVALRPGIPEDEEPPSQTAAGLVLPGDFANALDSFGSGTVGWNIFFNGTLCAMSCWHVFCYLDQDTPSGTRVDLEGRNIAEILAGGHVRVRFHGAKNWLDMALARYDDPRQAGNTMRACENGHEFPYPGQMALSVTKGDRVYKVGHGRDICKRGDFLKWGNVKVKYHNHKKATFEQQMIMTRMTTKGDSGSLAVRVSDNRVVGLNFAETSTETLANPIFRLPWTYEGMRPDSAGRLFPAFRR